MRSIFFILMSLLGIICLPVYAENNAEFLLKSTGFHNQDLLPKLYTCDGRDRPPQLRWKGAPPKTETFALILSDLDAPGGTFYHWVLYNIPAQINGFPFGMETLPSGVEVGKNSWGKTQYNGPCPPKGATHFYVFTLYALDTKLSLASGADATTVLDAIQKHILAKTELTASYGRRS